MGFGTGFVLGFVTGAGWALLFAPAQGEEMRKRLRDALAGRKEAAAAKGGGPLAGLRGALRSVRRGVQEALKEAGAAAQEAEEKMRERYREAVRQPGRRGRRR